jgi:hypothetical protein
MILGVNSVYFFKQHQPVELCNGEVWCSLWGTDWILKYYLDELKQVFLVFLCLQANAEMVPKFQVATACFSCRPPNFKLIKITPCCGCRRFVFQIIDKTIRNSKLRCLSEATPYHRNVFTSTLFLPEGRASVAWEPSNKMMLFLSPRKINFLSLHPLISSLNLLFGFKGLKVLSSRQWRLKSGWAENRVMRSPIPQTTTWSWLSVAISGHLCCILCVELRYHLKIYN